MTKELNMAARYSRLLRIRSKLNSRNVIFPVIRQLHGGRIRGVIHLDVADLGAARGQLKFRERFRGRIEARDAVGIQHGDPHAMIFVHGSGIRLAEAVRQRILGDFPRARIDFRQAVREKFAHPHGVGFAIGGRAPRTLLKRRRGIGREPEIRGNIAVFIGDLKTRGHGGIELQRVDLAGLCIDVRHAVAAWLRNPDIVVLVGCQVIIRLGGSERVIRIFSGGGIELVGAFAIRRRYPWNQAQ